MRGNGENYISKHRLGRTICNRKRTFKISKMFGGFRFFFMSSLILKSAQLQISSKSDLQMCAECPAADIPTVNPQPVVVSMNEGVDTDWVDEIFSNESDSKRPSFETASKVWSKAALRNMCVVSSKNLPGIFSKVT